MLDFLYDYFSAFQPHAQADLTILAIASMVFAALNIFLGYRLKRLWSTLIGVGVGFFFGLILGVAIWETMTAGIIAGVILAVIFGAIAFFIYKAGIFLLCGVSAMSLFYPSVSSLLENHTLAVILSVAIGIIIGVLSIIFMRPIIIFSTAIGGSFSFAQSLFALFPAATLGGAKIFGLSWPIWLVGSLFAVIGIVVQFVTTKNHGKKAAHR